jgi:predicted nuclease with TOPRIM domain
MAEDDLNDTLPPEPTATFPPPPRLPTGLEHEPYARVFASMSDRVLHIHEDVRELRSEVRQLNERSNRLDTALGNVASALEELTSELAAHRRVTEELNERVGAIPAGVSGHA